MPSLEVQEHRRHGQTEHTVGRTESLTKYNSFLLPFLLSFLIEPYYVFGTPFFMLLFALSQLEAHTQFQEKNTNMEQFH